MGYRIVVVDDDLLSLKSAKTLLNEQGMQVVCLRSGQELIKYLEKNTADIILLDILMPDMDGFTTYSAIRSLEEKENKAPTPVIFLTGENDSDVERRGLKEGASDFIRKPLDRDILIKRVSNTIENIKKIETLTQEATIDKLTGFLNKAAGTEQISGLCEKTDGALILLDLDNFKLVNDLFGHDMGDSILVAFSNVIRHCVRSGDVVSRIGGDEFMAFLPNLFEESALASLAERLNSRLAEEANRLMGANHGIPLGISMGASFTTIHGKEYNELFQYSDVALYKVKSNGKHGHALYEQAESSFDSNENLEDELLRISQIMSERSEKREALILGKEAFAWNFRFIVRFIERYDVVASRMLFSLSARDEGIPEVVDIDDFLLVLKKNLRNSDIIYQNRPNQFFVVLPLLTEEDSYKVVDRILGAWENRENHDRLKISYSKSIIKKTENRGPFRVY